MPCMGRIIGVRGGCGVKVLAALCELAAGCVADGGLLGGAAPGCCCLHCLGTACCHVL